jgi:hypothetical protein
MTIDEKSGAICRIEHIITVAVSRGDFRKSGTVVNQADRIRAFVGRRIAEARISGQVSITVRAGDVHRMMALDNAYAAVCSVLRGRALQSEAGVALISEDGRKNGANVWFHFDLARDGCQSTFPRPAAPVATIAARAAPASVDLHDALVLISCSKAKLPYPAPAKYLYCSPAFQMKRALAERAHAPWLILSAKYGIVVPNALIEPYDITLTGMGVAARREWAERVLTELAPISRKAGRVVFFAGQRYSEYLVPPLMSVGVAISEPLKGLRQGEQLAWLSAQ